jgi:tRNA U34 5-carboxymethylaminomethyl modifying GTPase MnmE/TrmE
VLDHNDSHERCDIDDDRLGAHVTFLQQIQDRLEARKANGDKKKIRVIFVLNKKDLWSQAKDAKFMSWFQKRAQEWSETGISVGEASMEMSATKEPKDIEELKRKIVTAARQLKK